MALKIDFIDNLWRKITGAYAVSKPIRSIQRESMGYKSVTFTDNNAGQPLSTTSLYSAALAAGVSPSFGRSWIVKEIVWEANAPCTMLLRVNIDPNNNSIQSGISSSERDAFLTSWNQIFDSAGKITVNGGDQIISEFDSMSLFISSTQSTKPSVKITMYFYDMTRDINYSADQVILASGDSLMQSGLGLTTENKQFTSDASYLFRMKNWLNLNGKNVALVNKSRANTTTTLNSYMLTNGFFDDIPYDLLLVGFGMNDAEANRGVSIPIYVENLKQYIYHRNKNRPSADIIFIAPPVTDSPSRVNTIAGYREAMQQVANDANIGGTNRGVYFYDCSTSFPLAANPATDLNNISTERTAGNRVHNSGYGAALHWENEINGGLKSVVQQTRFFNS